jgi:methanogenic corrinoid protein MtbC1
MPQSLFDRYLEPLLSGNRNACRELIRGELDNDLGGREVYAQLLWPAMERVELLFRKDRINIATEHMATRINRALADQVQPSLPRKAPNGKRILIMCASGEPEELGAQMCSDLFEADGWEVAFLGGGVPNDEVVSLVGQVRPEILLVFGTLPHGVPEVRALVDQVREIGSCPTMNIMISGGVFNRAAGLWKEINADLFAPTAQEAIVVANEAEPRVPEVRIPGAPKKRRRRRRPPLLAGAEA